MRAARRLVPALLALSACAGETAVVQTPDAGPPDIVGTDVVDVPSAPDVPGVLDVIDAPAMPDVVDAPAITDVVDAGPPRCARDGDCAAGRYCDLASGMCAEGCRDDGSCTAGASDGGVVAGRCDPGSRRCVSCVTDEHCPIGTLCVGNVCAAGCSATRGCALGSACCNGACVDTQTNPAACGACDRRCALPNATPACRNGTCAVGVCAPGFADCDGDPSNGCEVDTRTSDAHCGACGARCALANATATCAMGRCAVGSCTAPFADCDGNALNGCEADTRSAVAHCGMCGRACEGAANAVAVCAAGSCALTCTASFADCDGMAANGCEVNTSASAAHCGGCGRACSREGAAEVSCAASVCRVDRCATDRGDCDGMSANGCETDTATALAHCGACNRACAPVGGTGRCAAGRCELAGCNADRCDLDGDGSTGCEASRRVDEFDGSVLAGWTQAVGPAATYSVASGRVTFTDAPLVSTPSLPTHSWIYDFARDLGSQLQLSQPIGTGDFEVATAFSFESNVVELTLGYVALVDAQSRIVAYVGVHDGFTASLGAGVAAVLNGTSYSTGLASAGSHSAVFRRRGGALTITLDGQVRAMGTVTADIRAVALVNVRHRNESQDYPFGTFSVDYVRACY